MKCTDRRERERERENQKNNIKYYLLVSISETEFDLCGVASEV